MPCPHPLLLIVTLAQSSQCDVTLVDLPGQFDFAHAVSADGSTLAGTFALEATLLGPTGRTFLGLHGGLVSSAVGVDATGAAACGFA